MKRPSPTLIAVLFFILFDSFVFYGTYLNQHAKFLPIDLTSQLAPDFTWKDFDGKSHAFKEFSGHPVIVHFWASWCVPCREEFPELLKAANDNKDIMFLAIASDDNLEKPAEFAKMTPALSGIAVPANVFYAWDPNKALTYELFQTDRYPESIVIDSHMHLRRKFPSALDWSSPDNQAYFKELVEQK